MRLKELGFKPKKEEPAKKGGSTGISVENVDSFKREEEKKE